MQTSIAVVHGLSCSGMWDPSGPGVGRRALLHCTTGEVPGPITSVRFSAFGLGGMWNPAPHSLWGLWKEGWKEGKQEGERKILGEFPLFSSLFFGNVFTGASITGRGSLIAHYQMVLPYKHPPCIVTARLAPCSQSRPALGLLLLGWEAEPWMGWPPAPSRSVGMSSLVMGVFLGGSSLFFHGGRDPREKQYSHRAGRAGAWRQRVQVQSWLQGWKCRQELPQPLCPRISHL